MVIKDQFHFTITKEYLLEGNTVYHIIQNVNGNWASHRYQFRNGWL